MIRVPQHTNQGGEIILGLCVEMRQLENGLMRM